MIGQVVLSCLNRNSHIFILIDRSIYEKTQKYLVRISKYSAFGILVTNDGEICK